MTKIQNIGILTSGGDSQGMNACIRAITRVGIANKMNVFGIYDGFNGLIDNEIKQLTYTSVSNIIQRGGTILGTSRSNRFFKKDDRQIAYNNLKSKKIDALIIIGGDGSYHGAKVFNDEFDMPYIGIPATIDNDIIGTDYTLGFDTALNNIINAIDKIRDTASSHHRIFLVEVMGNTSGLLAMYSALTTGAEDVFIPEKKEDFERFEDKIKLAVQAKKSSIIIVSEGDEIGGAKELYGYLKSKNLHEKIRVSILGHIQRGGPPSYTDRKLGTLFGVKAIDCLLEAEYKQLIGLIDDKIITYKLSDSITKKAKINTKHLSIINQLSIY